MASEKRKTELGEEPTPITRPPVCTGHTEPRPPAYLHHTQVRKRSKPSHFSNFWPCPSDVDNKCRHWDKASSRPRSPMRIGLGNPATSPGWKPSNGNTAATRLDDGACRATRLRSLVSDRMQSETQGKSQKRQLRNPRTCGDAKPPQGTTSDKGKDQPAP